MLTEPQTELPMDLGSNSEQLPAPLTDTAIAMVTVARQSSSDHKRVSATPTPNPARRDDRHDNVRRDPRQDPERRPASASTITSEDIQATLASLQSQVHLHSTGHTRLARRDDDERRPRASSYFILPLGPPRIR